ncbi:MAG: HAMP domain-containing sensor histidine kinase [Planctomycetia bacterium]|nr:HAMP domain-containing sensor histidine kinase [Planctomycetia bacterium]
MNELDSETRRRLEQLKLDALAEFAAGAGHEINNPLAIISGYAQLLLSRTEDADSRTWLGIILAQTRRAYDMIVDTRTFARPPKPEPTSFILADMLRDFLTRKQKEAEARKIELIRVPSSEELPTSVFFSDPAHLVTVLDSVLMNAFEAVGEGGRIAFDVSVPAADGSLLFVVEDNGPGIPDAIRDQIFSPYFSGRQSGRGLGFGLCKAWRLLEGLGGEIDLEPVQRFATGCRWVIHVREMEKAKPDDQTKVGETKE